MAEKLGNLSATAKDTIRVEGELDQVVGTDPAVNDKVCPL